MKKTCPICHGTGSIENPHGKGKNMEFKIHVAKTLKEQGFSIREIMKVMGYKSPRSVQDLLNQTI